MNGHTPGPWFLGRHGTVLGGPEFQFAQGMGRKQIVMACVVPEGVEGDQEANARLIAAAPDLLEALQRIVCWDEAGMVMTEDHIAQARAAITKATGGQP